MDFWRLIGILHHRKWAILIGIMAGTLLAYLATRSTTIMGPRWLASVPFIATPDAGAMDLSKKPNDAAAPPANPQSAKAQAELQALAYEAQLRSRSVLEPALARIHLPEAALGGLGNIKVSTTAPGCFSLQVSATDSARAATLANALADSLAANARSLRAEERTATVRLLERQMQELDVKLAASRRRADNFRSQYHLAGNLDLNLGPALLAHQEARQKRDEILAKLTDSRARLRERERELALLPARVPVDPALLPRPAEPDTEVRQLQDDLTQAERQLAHLREQYADTSASVRDGQIAVDTARQRLAARKASEPKLPSDQPNPALAPLQQAIAEVHQDISGYEAQVPALNNALGAAEARVRRFESVGGTLGALSDEIAHQSEAKAGLADRLRSAQMALDSAERQEPIKIVDRVGVFNPPVNTTAGRTYLVLLLAALSTFCALFGLAVAVDTFDRRVKTVRDVELAVAAAVCAAIPQPLEGVTEAMLPRVTELQPLSMHSEAYRLLGLHVLNAPEPARSLMVVSAKSGQGCTSTATNLAITLAQAGKRVILVDANVRTPRLHEVFRTSNEFGLTNILQNGNVSSLETALLRTPVLNLRVIPSGPPPANPWELFCSENLAQLAPRLRELADYVVYDTPSAVAFTDALNLAAVVDAAFLCMRALELPTGAEPRLIEFLELANVTILGTVLSDVPASELQSCQDYATYRRSAPKALPAAATVTVDRHGSGEVAAAGETAPMRHRRGTHNGNGTSKNGRVGKEPAGVVTTAATGTMKSR